MIKNKLKKKNIMAKTHIVIPARYQSSRFPGKPLCMIAGRPMIWHVWQRAVGSGYESITIATDDRRIYDTVLGFGGHALMTSAHHTSGTERLAEAVEIMGWDDKDMVVNLQGDEPLMESSLITEVALVLARSKAAQAATLVTPISQKKDFMNPNIVKAVLNKKQEALYFSRAPIPWPREAFRENSLYLPQADFYRHIGMYAYHVGILKRIPKLLPSPLEQLECLEQLRLLDHGITIQCAIIAKAPKHGVDTKEDLARVQDFLVSDK